MLQHVLSMQRDKNMDLVSKPGGKSPVWLYFGLKADKRGKPLDSNQVICRLCRKVVLVKSGNTTNLRSHLTRRHRREFHKTFPSKSSSSSTSDLRETKGGDLKNEEPVEDLPQRLAPGKSSSFVPDSELPSGEPWLRGGPSRAALSLPSCLTLCRDAESPSSCPGSSGEEQMTEMKVYAKFQLQQGVMFGPFVGEICSGQMPTNVKYTWAIRDESAFIYVDAADENKSNWMRYVTYTTSEEEHNLVVFQFYRNIYYKVSQPIPEGGELRVSFGKDYASLLGLETGEGEKCKIGDKETALRLLHDMHLNTMSESSDTSLRSDQSMSENPMPVIRDVMTVLNPDAATDLGVISSSTLHSTSQICLPPPNWNPGEKYHFIPGSELLLSDPTASPHSPWYFFGFVPDQTGQPLDRSTAVCKLCDKQVNCAVGAADLQKHLLNKHHIKPRDGGKDRCQGTGQQAAFPLILSSPVTETIANFLIMDLHPLALVEGDGFKQLMRSFLPSYNDLTCLFENLLKDHHAKGKSSLAQLLRRNTPSSSNNEEMYDYTAPIEFESRRQPRASSSQKDIPHSVTLSVDVWLHSWQGNTERYITLWAHLIDSNFRHQNMALSTERLTHSEMNDGQLLEGQVKNMAEKWGIAHPNLVLLGVEANNRIKPGFIKSENGAELSGNVPHPNSTTFPERDESVSPGGGGGGAPSIPCFFRAAQRCVEDVMSHPVVSETLLQFQQFLSALLHHHGSYQNHAWRLLQVLTEKEQAGLKSWAQIWPAWNELYFILGALLKHKTVLCEVVKDVKAEALSKEDSDSCSANSTSSPLDVLTLRSEWRLLEDLCSVLKPLDVACRTLAKENFPRLSLVKPILTGLLSRHLVSRPVDSSTVKEVKSTIRKNLASCYGDPAVNRILSVACSLDPQFHGLRFMEEKEQTATFDWLKKEALRVVKEDQRRSDKPGQSDRSASPASPESEGERPRSKRLRKSQPVYRYDDDDSEVEEEKEADSQDDVSGMEFLLGDLFCAPPPQSRQSSAEDSLDNEISAFRADQRASLGAEPLEWWKTKAMQFPLLSAVARAFLAAPAVAGNAAKVFGDGGAARRKKSNIPPDDLDMILFLHHNHIPTGPTGAWLQDMSSGGENMS